jgi:hypothetical protein
MAIALDATADGGLGNPVTKLSWNHVLGSGAQLWVTVPLDTTGGASVVSSVIWDAAGVNQSFTKVGSVQVPGDRWCSLWVLKSPSATGTKQIDVNLSSSDAVRAESLSYTGCDTTTQPDSSGTNTSSATQTFTLTDTVSATGCWLIGVIKQFNGSASPSLTTPSGGSIRFSGSNGSIVVDSNGTVGTGSQTIVVDDTPSAPTWGGVIAAIKPASGGGGSLFLPPSLSMVGVQ